LSEDHVNSGEALPQNLVDFGEGTKTGRDYRARRGCKFVLIATPPSAAP